MPIWHSGYRASSTCNSLTVIDISGSDMEIRNTLCNNLW